MVINLTDTTKQLSPMELQPYLIRITTSHVTFAILNSIFSLKNIQAKIGKADEVIVMACACHSGTVTRSERISR